MLVLVSVVLIFLTSVRGSGHIDYKGTSCRLRWNFLPDQCAPIGVFAGSERNVPNAIWKLVAFAALQSTVTLTSHCFELGFNLPRDEAFWRSAAGDNGCRIEGYELHLGCVYGLVDCRALSLPLSRTLDVQPSVAVQDGLNIWPAQPFYLTILQALLATLATTVTTWKHSGPQPVAFGHLQTLADLVDRRSPVLRWGHKADGLVVCRPGTS